MRAVKFCLLLAVAWTAVGDASKVRGQQYKLTTLIQFQWHKRVCPYLPPVVGPNANLFGTTEEGGATFVAGQNAGYGTAFELNPNTGALTTLVSFNSSTEEYPQSGLIFGTGGNLYGTTAYDSASNYGNVFQLNPNTNTVTIQASLSGPNGVNGRPLFADASGNLYGTAGGFDSDANNGTLFRESGGTLTTLATFNGTNGEGPQGPLIRDAGGNLYGTTGFGGQGYSGFDTGDGTVFKESGGIITDLATFNGTNGKTPSSGVIFGPNGNLFGMTEDGGLSGDGTVFELNPNTDILTTLFSFNATIGDFPLNGDLIFGPNGNLFGTAQEGGAHGDGIIFELNPNTDALTTLFTFSGANGKNPKDGLVMDASGNLYGTAAFGSTGSADGEVFELSPVPEPPSIVLCLLAVGCVVLCRWKITEIEQRGKTHMLG